MGILDTLLGRRPDPAREAFLDELRREHEAKARRATAPARFELVQRRAAAVRAGEERLAALEATAAAKRRAADDGVRNLLSAARLAEQALTTAGLDLRAELDAIDRQLRADALPAVLELGAEIDTLLELVRLRRVSLRRPLSIEGTAEAHRAADREEAGRLAALREARAAVRELELAADDVAQAAVEEIRGVLPELRQFEAEVARFRAEVAR